MQHMMIDIETLDTENTSADYPSTDYVGGTQWWCHYFDGKEWHRELHAEDTLIPTEKDDGQ